MALHIYDNLEQGSEAWLAARRGMVTASVVGQLLSVEAPGPIEYFCNACKATAGDPCISLSLKKPTPIKTFHTPRSQWASDAAKVAPKNVTPAHNDTSLRLTLSLVAERITGHIEPVWVSDDMLRGQLDEPIARDIYSGHYAEAVEAGFMVRDDWGWSLGYSPDGLVGDDGLIEIKSRRQKKHLQTILADEVPSENMAQLQAGLLVSGREWIDYVSYSGGMPMWVKRVTADPKWAESIVEAVTAFEQAASEMAGAYDLATRGLPATVRRIDLDEIKVA